MSDIDKDLLDLLKDEDVDELDKDDDPKTDISELKTLVEDLTKQNQGLLKAKQSEKQKRQEQQKKLESIETKLNEILNLKNNSASNIVDSINKDKALGGIPVEFTEDGAAFIPQDKLNDWSKPYQQKINALEQALESTRNDGKAYQDAERIIRNILSEDERFPAVHAKYQKARDWVNRQVIDYQKENEIHGFLTSGQALDKVFNEDLEKQFSEKFPDMDLEAVVIAEDSERLFRKMLKLHVDDDTKININKDDDKKRFEKILRKPPGISDSRNAKTDLTIIDKLESLTQDDIMKLSDKQVKELEAALREEELRGK